MIVVEGCIMNDISKFFQFLVVMWMSIRKLEQERHCLGARSLVSSLSILQLLGKLAPTT